MKNLKNYAEKVAGEIDVYSVDPVLARAATHVRLLVMCIYLLDVCPQIGLSFYHVADNARRSIRENLRLIIEQLVYAPSKTYVEGLVALILDATEDLLHVDEYITEHTPGDASDNITQTNPAMAVRDAAIEALRAVLYAQAVSWDGQDVEDLRQIRADLCRLGAPDSRLGATYDEFTGLEIVGEDTNGRQLAVVVLE
jgi:hypothetical protein